MNFYIDTEFIEGFKTPLFGKRRHFIDLISIGIVAGNGEEYYAISNEFNPEDADKWVKENVLNKIIESYHSDSRSTVQNWDIYDVIANHGKSNKEIAKEIKEFVYLHSKIHNPNTISNWEEVKGQFPVNFYGWYSDYDWVVFCALFGKMIDLPKGFPMYCHDLKQTFDEKGLTKEWKNANCPEPPNAHNALYDARWNKKLHELLLNQK